MNWKLLNYFLAGFLIMLLGMAVYVWAGDEVMLSCTQAYGTVVYTNKDVKGCQAVKLPELSIVPSVYTNAVVTPFLPDYIKEPLQEDNTIKEPLQEDNTLHTRTCSLYGEWLDVQERTLGGFNHNSVQDTQRRMFLTQIFGSGFLPVGCR